MFTEILKEKTLTNKTKTMNMHLSAIIKKYLLAISTIALCYSCADDNWEKHYEANPNQTSGKTLWEQLEDQSSLSDFRELLDSVKVMNGRKITSVSYSDLFRQQYFTVFAPVNGTFNKDSLLALCTTVSGNEMVARQFVMSHLSRTPYSLSEYTDKMALMMNGKYLPFKNFSLGGVNLIVDKSNIVAKNGLIHYVNAQIPYVYNIYEGIRYLPELSGMGQFLLDFQKDSLDELASVIEGINEDGITVYVDSVLIEKNQLLRSFGLINSEDSSYRMIAPSKAGWDKAYEKVSKYFIFGYIPRADSLQKYWTKFTLMKDLFFNWNIQKAPQDSLVSTQYYYRQPKYHVFYNPFSENGILANAKETKVSNGIIYQVNEWPFDFEDVFFTPITLEAENEKYIYSVDKEKFRFYRRQKFADSISENGYLYLFPIKNSDKPDITFNIPNTLSGKYDVCVVMLPKTVYDPNTTDFKPNKFTARVNYFLQNGNSASVTCRGKDGQNLSFFENNAYKVDTLVLTTLGFPTCNYGQDKITVNVRLQSTVTPKEMTRYSQEMYIDCFYLKPRQD